MEGNSSRAAKSEAIRSVPFTRLNTQVAEQIREVVEHPSFYRRMPNQQVECDPNMFCFLVRRPEVMVNIWQLMGITQVSAKRLSPHSFYANDGVGTTCQCDLVYADSNLHIYVGDGAYDGSMVPRPVTGTCVCILRSNSGVGASGETWVHGTMDVFLKLDNLGADLLARSVGPFVGKTADYNFVETAKFISQISRVCQSSPSGAQNLVKNLDNIDSNVRLEFSTVVSRLGQSVPTAMQSAERMTLETEQFGRANSSAADPSLGNSDGHWVSGYTVSSDGEGIRHGSGAVVKNSGSVMHFTDDADWSVSQSTNDFHPESAASLPSDFREDAGPRGRGYTDWVKPSKENIFMRR